MASLAEVVAVIPKSSPAEAEAAAEEVQAAIKFAARFFDMFLDVEKLKPGLDKPQETLDKTMSGMRERSEKVIVDGSVKDPANHVNDVDQAIKKMQKVLHNLIQQVVTSTPANGEDLSLEASYLLVMLDAAAKFGCAKDGGRSIERSDPDSPACSWSKSCVDKLAVALQLYGSEGAFLQTTFKEYMNSLKICALNGNQEYVDRAMTTLRLLLAVLTSSALERKNAAQFEECLTLATAWRSLTNQHKLCKPHKMVDWIDRLLVDWMLTTVKADIRYPTIQWAFGEPLFEYVGTLAQQDPGVAYALSLVYKDVYFIWANVREEFRFIRDKVFAGRCFKNALYDWSKDIAGIYALLLIKKEYLHQYYEECSLASGAEYEYHLRDNGDRSSSHKSSPANWQ
eukprot:s470_g22.t1